MRTPACTCGHSVFAHPHDGPCIHAGCTCTSYETTEPDLMTALKDSLEQVRRDD